MVPEMVRELSWMLVVIRCTTVEISLLSFSHLICSLFTCAQYSQVQGTVCSYWTWLSVKASWPTVEKQDWESIPFRWQATTMYVTPFILPCGQWHWRFESELPHARKMVKSLTPRSSWQQGTEAHRSWENFHYAAVRIRMTTGAMVVHSGLRLFYKRCISCLLS